MNVATDAIWIMLGMSRSTS